MSRPPVIYWPPSTGIIANRQGTVLAPIVVGSNIQLLVTNSNNGGEFEYNQILRSIDISSTDDLSIPGVIYEVSGIGCTVAPGKDNAGAPVVDSLIATSPLMSIVEQIPAAGANVRAPSTHVFKEINSVKVLVANATNVIINYGQFGITDYVSGDYNRSALPLSGVGIQFSPSPVVDGIMGSIWMSLNKPYYSNNAGGIAPYGVINGVNTLPVGQFLPASSLIAPTNHDAMFSVTVAGPPLPFGVAWASVTNANIPVPLTSSMYFTVLQPGIT